jgi:hypothetical protein
MSYTLSLAASHIGKNAVRQDGGLISKFKIHWPFGYEFFDFGICDEDFLCDVWGTYLSWLKGGSSCVKRCLLILAGTKLHALRSFRVGSCAIALQATLANDFPFAEDAFVPFGLFGNIPPPLDLHGLLATQALIASSSYRKFGDSSDNLL